MTDREIESSVLAAAESLIFVLHCVMPPERVLYSGRIASVCSSRDRVACFVSADIDSRVLRDNQCITGFPQAY